MPLDYLNRPAIADLDLLLSAFRANTVKCIPADLSRAFAAARLKDKRWGNQPPMLAISFGGSNSAALLGERQNGLLLVHHAKRVPNPATPLSLEAFLESLLLDDATFKNALTGGEVSGIGVSIAVPIINGVPCHPSKLAQITGLVCPDMEKPDSTRHFGRQFERWMASHGFRNVPVRYEGDAPVAHLGGVAGANTHPDDRSLLAVVGTGMATANDREFILPSILPVLTGLDPQLFPPELCEGGQFQYQIAGKGIFKVLRRAIELANFPCELDWLASPADSKHVFVLWQGDSSRNDVCAIRERLGNETFGHVQSLASKVATRGVRALAACVAASLAREGPTASKRPYQLFFEGSIMRNKAVFEAFSSELNALLAHETCFRQRGYAPPAFPEGRLEADFKPIGHEPYIRQVDLTLLGAATLAQSLDHA